MKLMIPIVLLLLTSFGPTKRQANTIERNYCTELGVFNLVFDENEVAGSYSLNFKNSLGAIWGQLDQRKLTGRWMDADGQGDIILYFDKDWSFFKADYRGDDEPDKWYKDQWHGALKPQDKAEFKYKDINFKCK